MLRNWLQSSSFEKGVEFRLAKNARTLQSLFGLSRAKNRLLFEWKLELLTKGEMGAENISDVHKEAIKVPRQSPLSSCLEWASLGRVVQSPIKQTQG